MGITDENMLQDFLMVTGYYDFQSKNHPVLVILCFGLPEGRGNLRFRDAWPAVIPVAKYGCVYLVTVVILRVWPDFYGFNRGGMWYVSASVMLAASFVIGLMLTAFRRIRAPRN